MAEKPEEKEQDVFFPLNPSEEPDRDVPDDGDDGNHGKTLTEAEQESPTDSDLKITLKRLFPRYNDPYVDETAQAVMVGRIFPDTMLDRINLTVIDLIDTKEVRGDKDISVMMTLNKVTTAFEIGLDAKGRIDAIETHGSARESELESEGIGSRLGGGLG